MVLKEKLQAKWDGFDPVKRQNWIRAGIAMVGIAVCLTAYFSTGQSKKNQPPPQHDVSVIKIGEGRLEDDVRAQVEQQKREQEQANKETKEKLDAQQKRDEEVDGRLKAIADAMQGLKTRSDKVPGDEAKTADSSTLPATKDGGGIPQWPKNWANGIGGTPGGNVPIAPAPEPTLIGSIGSLAGAPAHADDKKKGVKKFYLPVSFMPARLLTGLKAKTVQNAQSDPEPMMLRIQAPAVLPNEVRAALKGCFVIANGFGSLASERIEARLVSMTCVDYDDQSVINADIKGILVDKDGTKGLAGHVVWKAGANLAWMMIGGAFQGAGQALQQSSTQVGVSPLGTTSVIQPNAVGKAAAGEALASGSAEVTKIFTDLVKQSAPVVEHGPDTDCGVVLTEGVWLEVKPYETDSEM